MHKFHIFNQPYDSLRNELTEKQIKYIRRHEKILVIDDGQFEYYATFQQEGYSIAKWDNVTCSNINELENNEWDIILLDIQGVGNEISKQQGIGILEQIKNKNPTQIIIIYSNDSYPFEVQNQISKADAIIAKGEDYLKFREIVNKQIKNKYTSNYYINKLHEIVGDKLSDSEIEKLLKDSINHNSPEIFIKNIDSFLESNKAKIIITAAITAIKVLQNI